MTGETIIMSSHSAVECGRFEVIHSSVVSMFIIFIRSVMSHSVRTTFTSRVFSIAGPTVWNSPSLVKV